MLRVTLHIDTPSRHANTYWVAISHKSWRYKYSSDITFWLSCLQTLSWLRTNWGETLRGGISQWCHNMAEYVWSVGQLLGQEFLHVVIKTRSSWAKKRGTVCVVLTSLSGWTHIWALTVVRPTVVSAHLSGTSLQGAPSGLEASTGRKSPSSTVRKMNAVWLQMIILSCTDQMFGYNF